MANAEITNATAESITVCFRMLTKLLGGYSGIEKMSLIIGLLEILMEMKLASIDSGNLADDTATTSTSFTTLIEVLLVTF
jgi:hypothetical protein